MQFSYLIFAILPTFALTAPTSYNDGGYTASATKGSNPFTVTAARISDQDGGEGSQQQVASSKPTQLRFTPASLTFEDDSVSQCNFFQEDCNTLVGTVTQSADIKGLEIALNFDDPKVGIDGSQAKCVICQ
ncbi:MAG: hypothetical protein Q9227_001655 [Pyrenula ochraceoflavens]